MKIDDVHVFDATFFAWIFETGIFGDRIQYVINRTLPKKVNSPFLGNTAQSAHKSYPCSLSRSIHFSIYIFADR